MIRVTVYWRAKGQLPRNFNFTRLEEAILCLNQWKDNNTVWQVELINVIQVWTKADLYIMA
jgi:6-phosphogluconolactonase (cycloisomerase 2 family)